MDEAEREQLKEKLRAIKVLRGNGIDLDSADRYAVAGLEEPKNFFRCLLQLVPPDTTLYFEGVDIVPEVARFFEANREQNPVTVIRDTISPTPDIFHVVLTSELIHGLTELLDKYLHWQCFEIIKTYWYGRLLLHFHDAFGEGADLWIADWVPETRIRAFCNCLGVMYRRERNVKWTVENLIRRYCPSENDQDYKDLTFKGFEDLAVEAVRVFRDENEALKNRLSDLEKRILLLEARIIVSK